MFSVRKRQRGTLILKMLKKKQGRGIPSSSLGISDNVNKN
jgi:hypothetical protein